MLRIHRTRASEYNLGALLSQCYTQHASRCLSTTSLHSSRPVAPVKSSLPTCRSYARRAPPRRPSQAYLSTDTDSCGDVIPPYGGSTQRLFPVYNEAQPTSVAILGGGISGLVAAYDLMRADPTLPITVFEATPHLGGWIASENVQVENGTVVFEAGPRTLRPHTPNGMVTLQLARTLGLDDEIVITPKSSLAAQNRFIYYPDHLVKMPGPGQDLYEILWTLLTEPAFKGLFKALVGEHRRPAATLSFDESVGDFLERRFGTRNLGDNIASAVLHGIYAGDINQLSAQMLLSSFKAREAAFGSLSQSHLEMLKEMKATGKPVAWMTPQSATLLRDLKKRRNTIARWDEMKDASVYSFKGGMQTLTDRLVGELRDAPGKNVDLRTEERVLSMTPSPKMNGVKIKTTNDEPARTFSHVICTLPPHALQSILPSPSTELDPQAMSQGANRHQCPSTPTHAIYGPGTQIGPYLHEPLSAMTSATVMVVNLYYPSATLPVQGFGYLIPRSIPYEQNPEMALGVVFDSDAETLDTDVEGNPAHIGTKLTVMLGGHYWSHLSVSEYPSEAEGLEMAKRVVARHLKIEDSPEVSRVVLQRNCIPQFTVGHISRLGLMDTGMATLFGNRVTMAGAAWNEDGVGLNDCVLSGLEASVAVKNGGATKLGWAAGPAVCKWETLD